MSLVTMPWSYEAERNEKNKKWRSVEEELGGKGICLCVRRSQGPKGTGNPVHPCVLHHTPVSSTDICTRRRSGRKKVGKRKEGVGDDRNGSSDGDGGGGGGDGG